MSEGITCYDQDENICTDEMCLRTGCRLKNARLAAAGEQKPVAWHPANDAPNVGRGASNQYIIAVYRKHSGKVYSFAAEYLNAYPLRYEHGCPKGASGFCDDCSEDGCPTTGWHVVEGADDDGYTYHSLTLDDGDEIKGWREVPQWGEDTSPQPAPGWEQRETDVALAINDELCRQIDAKEERDTFNVTSKIVALPIMQGLIRSSQSTSDAGGGDEHDVVDNSEAISELTELAEECRIDRLRLTAFKSNDASDRQAYFDATSKWFQDRHYRRMAALSNPAAADSNASAEARLREQVAFYRGMSDAPVYSGKHVANILETVFALSPDPHASDCEKQGEATKIKVPLPDWLGPDTPENRDRLQAFVEGRPSDRPADVTVESGLARALLSAFTVGRR